MFQTHLGETRLTKYFIRIDSANTDRRPLPGAPCVQRPDRVKPQNVGSSLCNKNASVACEQPDWVLPIPKGKQYFVHEFQWPVNGLMG